jgi:hypothetical protein
MLTTNQRLDQLAAARVDFTAQNMLNATLLESLPTIHELFVLTPMCNFV